MVVFALPAAAAGPNGTAHWSNNSNTGYCGQADGGYVVAAQSMLRTWGTYGGTIDNYWGSGSNSGLLTYQANRGLSADGCAGPSTWANMQALTSSFHSGAICGSSQGVYFRYLKGGRSSYFLRPNGGQRYWRAQAYPAGGPVEAFAYYRFSNALVEFCA
jgi:peptidoglycan hydrolase-like protein with peptidoglycan-binding domain